MSILTDDQRAIFDAWYTSHSKSTLDVADPDTLRVLAEASFEEGVKAAESVRPHSKFKTRYGDDKKSAER